MKIALFASGTGSNVKNIIEHFKNNKNVQIASVLSNNANAGALLHAINVGISTFVFNSQELKESTPILKIMEQHDIKLVVLAGFLLKIPKEFITNFSGKIINLHPSLLPKFGGKGMYGTNVHKAVLAAKETETGITIHFVNENYDQGAIIKQYKTSLANVADLNSVLDKIKELEKLYFPLTIEQVISKL